MSSRSFAASMTTSPERRVAQPDAETTIRSILARTLPPGTPPSFRRVLSARFIEPSRLRAELEMFDGQRAEVEAWQWTKGAWAHHWLRLDGGPLSWDEGKWRRVPAEPA